VLTECLAAISSARRECLDPMLITSGRHLRLVLSEYVERYNVHRPHRARNLRPPDSDGTLTAPVTDPTAARIRRRRVLGAFENSCHDYPGRPPVRPRGAPRSTLEVRHTRAAGVRQPIDREASTRHDALVIQRCRSEPMRRFWHHTGLIAARLALMGVIGLIADVLLRACGYAENVGGVDYLRTMTSADGIGVITFHDEGLARRLKALACTAPLHDLDTRKVRLDWCDGVGYQMAEIALQAIDQVTVAMDFDRGADHEEVVNRVLPFVAAQAPERDRAEHVRVARWVLDNLINVGSTDRGFRALYGTFGVSGAYERRVWDFRLLIELVSPDGEIYLRASDEAINVLVGALDTDVESAQIAAEVKLENLIRRGRLSDAQLAAQQARYRTVQYAETLRRKLEATRRDVRAVDWEHEVPDLIDEALTHIAERYRYENAILTNITQTRDEAEDPARKRKAAELVEIVSDCIRRHTQLQARLQEAGGAFRAEQDRQQFSGHAQRAVIDLFGHLLVPTLGLPVAQATAPVAAFFRAVSGLMPPRLPRLVRLVEQLLTPPQDKGHLLDEVPEPELAPLPDPDVFSDEQWRQSSELLELDEVPRRLSGLLADARILDPDLPLLIALRVLHALAPEIGVAVRQGDDAVLLAVDDGAMLHDLQFGGSDLLVGVARLAADGTAVAEIVRGEEVA
jgi:hypothetical protein